MSSHMPSMDISCSISVCLTKDEDYETSALLNDPFYSNDYTEPKNMFPPYIRLFSDNEDEPEPQLQHYSGWSCTCVTFSALKDIDIRPYLKSKNVISKKEEDDFIVNEKNLIANRIRYLDIFIDDSMSICPKHRSSYGIDWHASKSTCHHPDHNSKHCPSVRDCRHANITTCSKIEGFAVGGKKEILMIPDDLSVGPITTFLNVRSASEFVINDSRDSMNLILSQVNSSPIRSQTRKRLDKHSAGGLRCITSELTGTIRVIQRKMAETLAPWQSEQLLRISQLETGIENTRIFNETIDNEMVQNLKHIYGAYFEENMPFIEQQNTQQSIRQRADPEKIKHFVNWLVESSALVSGTYGLTVLRMDNGEKHELPKQILQLQKTHVLINYKKYCDETAFESLARTKLYDIINSIKPAQQQFFSGLGDFFAEGVEA
ncbi:unnamed protein product [Rotaria socialis]|uniref:Uncharacterized protein n=1 Tax=Rotaria socialis TaxID=392032 RepID=A0A820H2P3_9BILA|nr:unnamed protein product [Rotaria socialis]